MSSKALKQRELDWRRIQVLELSSQGYSQREIASRLQVDPVAVNRDINFLTSTRESAEAYPRNSTKNTRNVWWV